MQPTMKIRQVRRKVKNLPPEFNVYNGYPTETVLQQWWEHTVSIPIDGVVTEQVVGEWRDVPIEMES